MHPAFVLGLVLLVRVRGAKNVARAPCEHVVHEGGEGRPLSFSELRRGLPLNDVDVNHI